MKYGILAGVLWALETITLGTALKMSAFVSTEQAVMLAPFVSTFIHDFFSAFWACGYNIIQGNLKNVGQAIKTRNGKFVMLAAVIGGPVGMTGYVLSINNMGASIGAAASAIFPAIGAMLAHFFLKEKIQWYRWIFLIVTLLGVYGLSYSSEINIANFWLGFTGTLMCAFGWGIEAVVLAKCMKDTTVTDEIALQIRQITSAMVYGIVIIPVMNGWEFTISLFTNSSWIIPVIAVAAFFATASYLFYYKAIKTIGAAKAMALDVSYGAWAVIFTVILLRDFSGLNLATIICVFIVVVCSILVAADYKEVFGRKNKEMTDI